MLLIAASDSPGKLVLVLAKEKKSVKKRVILATCFWFWVFSSRPHKKRLRLISSSLQGLLQEERAREIPMILANLLLRSVLAH